MMRYLKQLWLPALFVIYVFVTVATIMGQHGVVHLWNLREEQQSLEAEVVALLRENEDLRERISRLQKDDEFLEKVVREELKFVKEREYVYLFRGSSDASQ